MQETAEMQALARIYSPPDVVRKRTNLLSLFLHPKLAQSLKNNLLISSALIAMGVAHSSTAYAQGYPEGDTQSYPQAEIAAPVEPFLSQDNFAASEPEIMPAEMDPAENAAQAAENGFLLDSTQSAAPSPSKVQLAERSEENLFIVESALDKNTIFNPGLLVFIDEENDTILVPLSQMVKDLEFEIKVDPVAGFAEGWFVSEDQTFFLQYPYNSINIGGKEMPIEGVVESHSDDIYVDIKEMSRWFPLELTFNFNELRLYVEPTEELPFQALAARRQRWKNLKARQRDASPFDDKDLIVLPYQDYAAPTIQVQHNVGANKTGDETSGNYNTTLQSRGDAFGHATRFNLSHRGDSDKPEGELNNAFLNFSKSDYRANLLGFMEATEYEFGDLTARTMPLTVGNQRGVGFTASNAPYNFVHDPAEFIIEGFAPVGWDAEVYLDERLLGFQTVDTDGRYLFQDLQLRDGFNLFKIVLYGPNGEKEERYERFFLGQDMIDKGDFIYDVSTLLSSSPLLPLQNEQMTDPTVSLLGEYGVTNDLSAYAGYFIGPDSNSTLNALGAGLRLSTSSAYYQFNTLAGINGELSGNIMGTGNINKNMYWNAGHLENSGFQRSQRTVNQESYFRFSQRFASDNLAFGSYSLGAKRSVSDTGVLTYAFTNNISGALFGFNLNNDIEHEFTKTGTFERTIGDLTIRKRSDWGMLRGKIDYELVDITSPELQAIDLLYQAQLSEFSTINLGFNSSFIGDQLNTISASLNKRFDKFTLSALTSFDDTGNGQVGLGVSYNFVPQSLYGDYRMTGNTGDLNMGILQVEPFIDGNEDGVRNENEEIVPGVTVKNMLRGVKGESDENGIVALPGMTPDMVNRITLDIKSIPSIYLTPAKDQLKVFGKAGVNGPVGYPLILLGELSGTLYQVGESDYGDDPITPLPNTEIVLLDENDNVVAQTLTEYDGFFVLPSLHMGSYKIYLPASEQLMDIHRGDGAGPSFVLNKEQSETMIDLVVMPNKIVDYNDLNDGELARAYEMQLAQMPEGSLEGEPISIEEVGDEEAAPVPQVAVKNSVEPDTVVETTPAPASVVALASPQPAKTGRRYIQAGLFCDAVNAERRLETLLVAGFNANMKERMHDGKACQIIDIPAAPSELETRATIDYLKEIGFDDAFYAQE